MAILILVYALSYGLLRYRAARDASGLTAAAFVSFATSFMSFFYGFRAAYLDKMPAAGLGANFHFSVLTVSLGFVFFALGVFLLARFGFSKKAHKNRGV